MKMPYIIRASLASVIMISTSVYAAPSLDELQATIQKLLLQVQQLQQQINQQSISNGGGTSVAQVAPVISKKITLCVLGELKYGESSESVVLLQTILKKTDDYPKGIITGYYGPLTRAAVIHFQKSSNLTTSGGVDTKTADQLNSLAVIYISQCGFNGSLFQVGSVKIAITSSSMVSGPTGSTITFYGSGLRGRNVIHFGGGIIAAGPSNDDREMSFPLPPKIVRYCGKSCRPTDTIFIMPGEYKISVENQNGISNIISFTVTGEPHIIFILGKNGKPIDSASVGDIVTVIGTGFAKIENSIRLGNGYLNHLKGYQDSVIQFKIPERLDTCLAASISCISQSVPIDEEDSEASIINANGQSAYYDLTIN